MRVLRMTSTGSLKMTSTGCLKMTSTGSLKMTSTGSLKMTSTGCLKTTMLLAAAAYFALLASVPLTDAATQPLKFNRSQFLDLSEPCSRTGVYHAILNRTHPVALVKLDIRYKTLVTYQTFDCLIKVKTEFMNKSRGRQDVYSDNEDIAVMMFDINYGYKRKEDAINLDLIHIAKLDQNGTRFFYQKKKFRLPQYIPQHLPGYVMYGFEEIAQWHAESNSSIAVELKRWKSSDSIYFVFAQYKIVSPYHCDTGIEVACNENSAVFAHCFPHKLLSLFLDGLPFCEFHPLHAVGSNRTTCGALDTLGSSSTLTILALVAILAILL